MRPTRPPSWPAGPRWSPAWPTPAGAKPSWTRPRSSTRQAWPGPRKPGSGCPRWPSGCARRTASRWSGTVTCRPSRSRSGRAGIPDELERQAAELREEEESLLARLAIGRDRLSAAVAERSGAEAQLAAVERRIAEDARAAANRADGLARLRAQVGAASSRQGATAEEIERLSASAEEARARAGRAQQEHSQVEELVSGHDEGRAELAAAHEEAAAALTAAARQVAELRAAEGEATRHYAALRARAEALQEAFRRGADASADLLATSGRFSGIIGPFAEALSVEEGAQTAIAAALGASANAVAVTDLNAAIAILTVLRESGAGTAGLVIAGYPEAGHSLTARPPRSGGPGLPPGARYALDLVRASDELRPAVTQLLSGVIVAASLEQAADLLRASPALRVVTRDGDLLGPHWATGGSAGQQSLLEVRAAADDAAAGLQDAQAQCEHAAQRLAVAVRAEEAARQAVDEARARMRQADSAASEISGRLGRLAGAARAASDEVRRLEAAIDAARRAGEKDLARLAELTSSLAEGRGGRGRRAGRRPDRGRRQPAMAPPRRPRRSRKRWPSGARWRETPRWKPASRSVPWKNGSAPSKGGQAH